MKTAQRIASTLIFATGALACTPLLLSQSGTSVNDGDWPNIHGEISSQRYSPLDQINVENVKDLEKKEILVKLETFTVQDLLMT